MTDEDIKAIRMLEFIVNHNSLLGYKPENREALAEYIINLIEKQEKEIKILKEQKEYVINEYGRTIEGKDKMINEMAKYIDDTQMEVGTYFKDKNEVIEYFKKKVGE